MKDLIKEDKNLFVYEKKLTLVAIFDHKFYRRNDLELVDKAQRKYIQTLLSPFEYEWQGSSKLASKKNENIICFNKLKVLGNQLFEKYSAKKNEIIIITPTQLVYYIMINEDAPLDLLKNLIRKCPINIEKLSYSLPEPTKQRMPSTFFKELHQYQNEQVESDYFKGKNHIGRYTL